jgi:hypothetical protein
VSVLFASVSPDLIEIRLSAHLAELVNPTGSYRSSALSSVDFLVSAMWGSNHQMITDDLIAFNITNATDAQAIHCTLSSTGNTTTISSGAFIEALAVLYDVTKNSTLTDMCVPFRLMAYR